MSRSSASQVYSPGTALAGQGGVLAGGSPGPRRRARSGCRPARRSQGAGVFAWPGRACACGDGRGVGRGRGTGGAGGSGGAGGPRGHGPGRVRNLAGAVVGVALGRAGAGDGRDPPWPGPGRIGVVPRSGRRCRSVAHQAPGVGAAGDQPALMRRGDGTGWCGAAGALAGGTGGSAGPAGAAVALTACATNRWAGSHSWASVAPGIQRPTSRPAGSWVKAIVWPAVCSAACYLPGPIPPAAGAGRGAAPHSPAQHVVFAGEGGAVAGLGDNPAQGVTSDVDLGVRAVARTNRPAGSCT